ncbi:MAG: 3'-5' exonuclease [Paludibacteraceae bacterium]
MEEAKKQLEECYNRAKKAYEEKDYEICLGKLRVSIEWLSKVLIYEFAGQEQGTKLLTRNQKVLLGTPIVPPDKHLESTYLIKAIPAVLTAMNTYRLVKGDKSRAKETIKKQVDALVAVYGVCSEIAMHASGHNMNLKAQAENCAPTIRAFIDILHSVGILKDTPYRALSSILPSIISSSENNVSQLKSDLDEANKKLDKISKDAQTRSTEQESIIDNLQIEKNDLELRLFETKQEALRANQLAQEKEQMSENEIKALQQKIQELERQLEQSESTRPDNQHLPELQQSANTIKVDLGSLDDDQIDLIEQNFSESMLVAGCAGSGKSVIAMHKAQQIIDAGASVILIAYTKSLQKFMNMGWNRDLQNHCMYYYQWKKQKMPSADYIIVDEIQDFTKDEIEEFIHAAKKCFFFFGDTAQSIYNFTTRPTMSVEQVAERTGLTPLILYNNYRLPRSVAKITQDFVGVGVKPYSDKVYKSKETTLPHIIGFPTDEAQIETIISLLQKEDFSERGILLPNNDEVANLYKRLLESRITSECKYSLGTNIYNNSLDFSTSLPKIMTYHSAKGLQFDTVILPFCQSVRNEEERKALYVAMTRTKKNLFILYTGTECPEPLNKVPEHLFMKEIN